MKKKRKKKGKNLTFILFFAALIAIGIYAISKFSIDYSGECSILENNIDRILHRLKVPENNTETWRTEKKKGFRKWVEINKKITISKSKKRKFLMSLDSLKNYKLIFKAGKSKVLIKRDDMIFAKIFFMPAAAKPMMAIVIDDCGRSKKEVARLVEIGIPLTFSILPYQRYTTFLNKSLTRAGFDTLLHQPMEPHKADNYALGKGALRVKMKRKEIEKILLENLSQTPLAKGVNNHMGSLFTEKPALMKIVFETLRKKDLFFLDSATSRKSACLEVARKMGFPCLRNSLFIDNADNLEDIKREILIGARIAQKKGTAIVIGHSTRKFTAEALREEKKNLSEKVKLVPLSVLYGRR